MNTEAIHKEAARLAEVIEGERAKGQTARVVGLTARRERVLALLTKPDEGRAPDEGPAPHDT